MQKKNVRAILLGILALALLAYEIGIAKGENYYYVSLGILLLGLLGFFSHFEQGRPDVLLLTMMAAMCGLAIAGRIAFFFLPQVKPILAFVTLAGIAFGGEVGFVTGAMSAFVSNFYFGQGSWTPFQMFAMGLIGFWAGVLFAGRNPRRWVVALYGFVATLILCFLLLCSLQKRLWRGYIWLPCLLIWCLAYPRQLSCLFYTGR